MKMHAHAEGAESTEGQGGYCEQVWIERGRVNEYITGCFSTKQFMFSEFMCGTYCTAGGLIR